MSTEPATPPKAKPARRNTNGQFAREPHVRRRLLTDLASRGLAQTFYDKDRRLHLALKREHDLLAAELGKMPPDASASALMWSLVETRMRRDTLAAIVFELGRRIVNKQRRAAYPIVAQLNDVERLLADLVRQFTDLKTAADLERRIEALEDGNGRRAIDVTPT